jgi:hypothetical protein
MFSQNFKTIANVKLIIRRYNGLLASYLAKYLYLNELNSLFYRTMNIPGVVFITKWIKPKNQTFKWWVLQILKYYSMTEKQAKEDNDSIWCITLACYIELMSGRCWRSEFPEMSTHSKFQIDSLKYCINSEGIGTFGQCCTLKSYSKLIQHLFSKLSASRFPFFVV